ncbi:MAG: hypothetical protein V1861_02555 [Candidatus Micrarchaeota archaeon]
MIAHRPKNFDRISSAMLRRLERHDLETGQKITLVNLAKGLEIDHGVRWGGSRKMVTDVLRIINDHRKRDGRPLMDEAELREAVRALLNGKRKEPLVEELSDALSNLREVKLGVRKMPPPLDEDLKRIA